MFHGYRKKGSCPNSYLLEISSCLAGSSSLFQKTTYFESQRGRNPHYFFRVCFITRASSAFQFFEAETLLPLICCQDIFVNATPFQYYFYV